MNQKGVVAQVIVVIISLIILVVFLYSFLARPFSVGGDPIALFKKGETTFAERVTYIFNSPEIGDRVVFIPKEYQMEYIGIITKINEDKNIKTFTIISSGKGTPWEVTKDKIIWKVYFPKVSKEEITLSLASLPKQESSSTTSSNNTPIPSTEDIEKWLTYTNTKNGYEVRYPPNYALINEDTQTASFGLSGEGAEKFAYLIISSKDITDIKSFPNCAELPASDISTHCIADGSGWGQKESIQEIMLGSKKAVSFYLGGGVDFAYHIIQTTEQPKLELKMYVAGGGLDGIFDQILSTFKFTN